MELGLPHRREMYSGALRYLVGSKDVEEWLHHCQQEESLWTAPRIAAVTGIQIMAIHAALQGGKLRADTVQTLTKGKVAHLSPFVSSKKAGKLSGLGQTAAVKAIRSKELEAIQLEAETGPQYFIPRGSVDRWLEKLGLPPSWELESASEWLRVPDAAQPVGLANPTIQKWISLDKLEKKRVGRRWLVSRQSLLEEAERYRPGFAQYTSLAQGAEHFALPLARLEEAVRQGQLALHPLGSGAGQRGYLRIQEVKDWLSAPG